MNKQVIPLNSFFGELADASKESKHGQYRILLRIVTMNDVFVLETQRKMSKLSELTLPHQIQTRTVCFKQKQTSHTSHKIRYKQRKKKCKPNDRKKNVREDDPPDFAICIANAFFGAGGMCSLNAHT